MDGLYVALAVTTLCLIGVWVLRKLIQIRAEPEERARVVRDFFQEVADEFARSGINLTIEESGSTFIYAFPSDMWKIAATTSRMNWGLVISLAYSSQNGNICVDFKLDDTAGTASELRAKQKTHEILKPLVTGEVLHLSPDTLAVIPRYGNYFTFNEIVGHAKELVECLMRQKSLYEKMRSATEAHTLDLAFYYDHRQDLHTAITKTIKDRLVSITKENISAP